MGLPAVTQWSVTPRSWYVLSVCPYGLCRTVQSKSQCYHMELTVGQMAWLMCLGLGVRSATQHHTRSSERRHNSVVFCVTLPVERDETRLSPLPPLRVAESRGTCRLNWSCCSTWVNVELRMNAGYERAGRDVHSHVRAGAADHMIPSEMPAVPPASLCHNFFFCTQLKTQRFHSGFTLQLRKKKFMNNLAFDVSEVRL